MQITQHHSCQLARGCFTQVVASVAECYSFTESGVVDPTEIVVQYESVV